MDQNKVEIKLLKTDPEKLLLAYQGVIWTIVRTQVVKGMLRLSDQEDLVQEINKKLLERLPRIREQYKHSSKLKTYFSVIIRNICLEEFRKPAIVSEPEVAPYGANEQAVDPVDTLLISQEYERLRRVFVVMGHEGQKLNILLKVMFDVQVDIADILSFEGYSASLKKSGEMVKELNNGLGKRKLEKFALLSQVLQKLEGKPIPSDSLRKWYTSRLTECLKLLNGYPPRSAYDVDTLGFLIEKVNLHEKR